MSGRPLGASERALWRVDRGAPLNITITARVKGPLSESALRAALPALRARHPHLRERIVEAGSGADFVDVGVPPLALRVVDGTRAHEATVIEEVEREINEPIPSDPGPLARFCLVTESAETATLIVTVHHAISDGHSVVLLVRDWVEAAAQAIAGAEPALTPLADPGPMDAVLPAPLRGLRGVREGLRCAVENVWPNVRHGRPIRSRRDAEVSLEPRRTRVIWHELDEATTAALTTRARAEGATVHGAMAAAILLGVIADQGSKSSPRSITFASPVNARARLEPPVGEELGLFASSIRFRCEARTDLSFWDVARAVRSGIESELAHSAGLGFLKVMPTILNLLGRRLTPPQMAEHLERVMPVTTGLTNLGRLDIAAQHGPLFIESCRVSAGLSALGELLATAASMNGRVQWTFLWSQKVFTEAHARALANDIVHRVEAAAGLAPSEAA